MDTTATTTIPRRNWKRIAMTAAALALTAFLFALFIRRAGDMAELSATIKSTFKRPDWLVAGVGLFSVSLMCGMLRWFILLKTLKLPVPFWVAFRLYATGHFFNILGPGATGGDIVKAAWLASNMSAGQRTAAVTSIAAERLIGLMAMIVFVTFIAFFRADFFAKDALMTVVRHGIMLAFVGAVAIFVLLTAINWEKLAGKIKTRDGSFVAKALAMMVKIWRTFKICLSHPAAASGAFALSIANHITDVCCYFLLSRALSMTLLFKDMMAISPISNTIAAAPLTPGGAGMRENALQYMMTVANVPTTQSTALGLLMFASIVFWALIAGCIMLAGRHHRAA